MKRTLAILLCLMLTGCMKTVPPAESSRLTASTKFGIHTETTVSNTEPTATEMTEEKTVQTVRVTTQEKPDAPALTERTEPHRTTESTEAEAVQEPHSQTAPNTAVTTAHSNPPPVICSQTSRTTTTVQIASQITQTSTTAKLTTVVQTTPQIPKISTTAAAEITVITTTETEPPPQSYYDYNRIPAQLQIFMEEYEINADALFAIGRGARAGDFAFIVCRTGTRVARVDNFFRLQRESGARKIGN